MTYLIVQMLFCLLLAALIGGWIGWLLRGSRSERLLAEQKAHWEMQLEQQRTEYQAAQEELEIRSSRLETTLSDLEDQRSQVEILGKRIGEQETRVQELQGDLDARQAALDEGSTEIAALTAQLAAAQKTGATSAAQQHEEAGLEARREQAEAGSEKKIQQIEARWRERLERCKTGAREAKSALAERSRQLASVNSQWLEAKQASEDCQAETARLTARIAELQALAGPASPAPAVHDDLKKIWGIGRVLEGFLNERGITSYRQIVEWTAEDIARFSQDLPQFTGRIERDGWIEGAREQHFKKYGEKI